MYGIVEVQNLTELLHAPQGDKMKIFYPLDFRLSYLCLSLVSFTVHSSQFTIHSKLKAMKMTNDIIISKS